MYPTRSRPTRWSGAAYRGRMATQKQPATSRKAAPKAPATRAPRTRSATGTASAPATKKGTGSGGRAAAKAPSGRIPTTGTPGPVAAAPVTRAAPESRRAHRSAVAALLAEHPGDTTGPKPRAAGQVASEVVAAGDAVLTQALEEAGRRAAATVSAAPGARHAAPAAPAVGGPAGTAGVHLSAQTGLPPLQDVALGAVALLAERMWAAGTVGLAWANGVAARTISLVRAVSPQVATAQADARLQALAERGQRVRVERTQALTEAVTAAISSAATSDAMREMTVAAIEQATDEVLDVVLPAVLEAVTEMETQDKLDELMSGLLLRTMPSALEKIMPGVMLRTATKPALGIVPSLMGALASGLSGEASTERG